MNIKFTTLTVKDLEQSVAFYQDVLQLKEIRRFSPHEGITIVFLEDEHKTLLELIEHKNGAGAGEGAGKESGKESGKEAGGHSIVSLGFEVENLLETLEALKGKGIAIQRGPIETPSGEKFAFIKDPNGFDIEFIQGFNPYGS